ncbi:MAG: flippase-like domain-containing protein, partial [Planctomycetota bacterium]
MHISILLVLSVAVLAVPVFAIGFAQTVRAVMEAGVAAFAAVGALTLAFLLIQSVAWTILNRPVRHRVPFRTLFEASVVGLAGNLLTPSTFLGGEPLKIIYVGRNAHLPYHEVAGTVLMSKYLEGISFILFFSFSAVVAAAGFRDLLFGPYLAVGL